MSLSNILICLLSFLTCVPLLANNKLENIALPNKDQALLFLQDPKIKKLALLSSYERPGKCPLKSTLRTDLIEKMIRITSALSNGYCENKHKVMMNSFSNMTTKLNRIYYNRKRFLNAGILAVDNFAITDKDSSADDSPQSILNNMAKATNDEECLADIKKHGLLSTMADVAESIGQMAIIVPSANGMMLGVGGMLLGSSLKIIDGLFKAPFLWTSEKDRSQFLELNCTFFDIRHELEASDFFKMQDDNSEEKISDSKQALTLLTQHLEPIEAQKKIFENHVQNIREAYLKAHMNPDDLALFTICDKIVQQLKSMKTVVTDESATPALESIHKEHLNIQTFLIEAAPSLEELIQKHQKTPYQDFLLSLLEPFVHRNYSFFANLEMEKFDSQYLFPIITFLESLRDLHSEEVKRLSLEFDKEPSGNKLNSEIMDQAYKAFDAVIEPIQTLKAKITKRIHLLELRDRKDLWNIPQEGAQASFDIIREYASIRNLILGKRGWTFISFLNKSAAESNKNFHVRYQKWEEKYLPVIMNTASTPHQLTWACRDAFSLRLEWDSARASLSLLYDFYETNKGIMSSDMKKVGLLFSFIPIKSSFPYRFYTNMLALEMAKSIISGKTEFTREQVRKARAFRRSNSGTIILDIQDSEANRRKIETFINDKECAQFH